MRTSPSRPIDRARSITTIAVAAITATLAFAGVASSQDSPSVVELKAAAYDAQQKAAEAQRAAADAQTQASQAQAAIDQAKTAPPPAPPAPAVAATPPAPPSPAPAPPAPVVQTPPAPAVSPPAPAVSPPAPVAAQTAAAAAEAPKEEPVTREDLDRAIEKAENAAATARRVQEELDQYKERYRMRYARNGLTMSAGAFWAPEFFDTTANVDPSLGLSGGIGYRVHPHFSIDASFIWADGFSVETQYSDGISLLDYQGDVQMWSALLGGKFYILTGKIQPYLGIGFGASGARWTLKNQAGAPDVDFKGVGGVIAFNGGLELYVSESLALGLDAAAYLPGGELSGLDFSTLGAKLIYRF